MHSEGSERKPHMTLDSILLGSAVDVEQVNDEVKGTKDVFVGKLMSTTVKLTTSTNTIPSCNGSTNDFDYFVSTIPSFSSTVQGLSLDLLKVIRELIKFVNPYNSLPSLAACYEDTSILYEGVVDTLDEMLESADLLLDSLDPSIQAKISSSLSKITHLSTDANRLFRSISSLDIPKPQENFIHEIENSRNLPFHPKLRDKPHAIVPLNLKELRYDERHQKDTVTYDEIDLDEEDDDVIRPLTFYPHPYEHEISSLNYTPNQLMDISASPISMPPADQPFEYIEDDDDLQRIIDELTCYKEVAIDLEHHSHRTFAGITCLMQLSTRDKDYVIDAIALRYKMFLLNEVFANPSIVKVFHGCKHDIEWLQRDFGLYIVNSFDTYLAAKELRFPALSLAHLAKVSCGVIMDKKYQLADWRLRPLTDEMIAYAKNDTHYLLYIYDYLRKEIWKSLGQQGIISVLDSSRSLCMRRYEKDVFRPKGYKKLLKTRNGDGELEISFLQEQALKKLWDWRDYTARNKDESLSFIMTNKELLRISLSLPLDENELLKCTNIPHSTRIHAKDILDAMNSKNTTDDTFTPVRFQVPEAQVRPVNFQSMKVESTNASKKRKATKRSLESKKECATPYVENMLIDSEIDSNNRWGEHGKLDGYSTVLFLRPFSFPPFDSSSSPIYQKDAKSVVVPTIKNLSSSCKWSSKDSYRKLCAVKEKIRSCVSRTQVSITSTQDEEEGVEILENHATNSELEDIPTSFTPLQRGHHEDIKHINKRTQITMAENVTAEVPMPLADAYDVAVPNVEKSKKRRKSGFKRQRDRYEKREEEQGGDVSGDVRKFDYDQLEGLRTMSALLDEGTDVTKIHSNTVKKKQLSNKSQKKNPYFR